MKEHHERETSMDTLKNIWNRIDEYVKEHDSWLIPAFIIGGFASLAIVICVILDPKLTTNNLEVVKTYIVKMDYEGHSYLLYKRLAHVAMCHDENCKCKEKTK